VQEEKGRAWAEGRALDEWTICVSYLEIYNETLMDLLSGRVGLGMYDRRECGVVVDGLSEEEVSEWGQAAAILTRGDERRHISCTAHNSKSSRSHTVFRIRLERRASSDASMRLSRSRRASTS